MKLDFLVQTWANQTSCEIKTPKEGASTSQQQKKKNLNGWTKKSSLLRIFAVDIKNKKDLKCLWLLLRSFMFEQNKQTKLISQCACFRDTYDKH